MSDYWKPLYTAAGVSTFVALVLIGTIQLCCWMAGAELIGAGADFVAAFASMTSIAIGAAAGLTAQSEQK